MQIYDHWNFQYSISSVNDPSRFPCSGNDANGLCFSISDLGIQLVIYNKKTEEHLDYMVSCFSRLASC